MIKAGKLREKIIILEPSRVQNDSGKITTTYAVALETFADVRELKSSAELIEQQENIIQLLEFTMRYRPDVPVVNGYRLTWRGFNFTVNNMRVDPLRTWIKITAQSEIETSDRSGS